ncbi:MAG: protein kinase [Chlamydiales bacterium]|nr:protein kinase [Chlamydiales bacterium]
MAAIRSVRSNKVAGPLFGCSKSHKKTHLVSKSAILFNKILQKSAASIFEKSVSHQHLSQIQDLETALHTNDTVKIKELFSLVINHDPHAEKNLNKLYSKLKAETKAKSAFDTFKKTYCEYVIQQSVLQNKPEMLSSKLAHDCKIADLPHDFFVTTLLNLGNKNASRIAREVAAIAKIPFSRHKLKTLEMLKICVVAEDQLNKLATNTRVIYKTASELNTARACVLDPVRHTFTILSKSKGELDATGAFKRVSDAIEVAIKGDTALARRVAHVRNRPDEHIPSSELEFEMLYGDVISWTRYKSKNRPDETKTLLLQEVYDHDLYIFTEFTPEEKRKKISIDDMIDVLEIAGKSLLKLHEDGIVHRDVKAKNILYRKGANGQVFAKLIDFGHCYEPDKSSQLRKRTKGYGTLRYTAPDLLENPGMKGDPLFLAKAEDAYALGECIYEVYLQQATPWGSLAYRALKKKKDHEENRETAIRLQKEEAAYIAQEAKKLPEGKEKELFRIMARLLEPNPKKRMQMPELVRALYDLKARYATMAAS